MKLTPAELKQLPKGIYVMNKCDHCEKLLTGFLTYRGINNEREYCSNACYEAGEHPPPGFQTKPRSLTTMITKKLDNKAALPKAEETKKAKGVVGKMEEDLSKSLSNPEPDPKKGKKGTPAPPPKKGKKEEEEAPPKKGKKEEEEAPPKKGKTAPPPKKAAPAPPPKKGKKEEEAPPKKGKTAPPSKAAKTTPYREGSSFARAFQRLMAGKALTLEQMFEGVEAGDPSRMASHMIRRGDESKEFKIVRQNDGRLLMTKIFGK